MTTHFVDPVETALLARLLVSSRRSPSEAEVLKSLRPLIGASDGRLRTTLARLEADGLRSSDMRLTAKGKQRICDALGVSAERPPTQWRAVKARLVEVALGHTATRRSRPLTAANVRAAALAGKLGLPSAASPTDVLDAWAARELGMGDQRLTIANVRAYALSRALGIGALRNPKHIASIASAKVLGVPRTDANTVRDAILRDWLVEPKRTPVAADDLSGFASRVKDVARGMNDDNRFGRFKVFIAPIWQRMRAASSLEPMSEGDFKEKLVAAHRAGFLRLTRADLTPAMAPQLVAASEVPYLNAVFHFVDLEGTLS